MHELGVIDNPGTVCFGLRPENCLDRCSAFAIRFHEVVYPTAEHAYQAWKFITKTGTFIHRSEDDVPVAELIRRATSPYDARKIAHSKEYAKFIREDWCDELRIDLMEAICRAKYEQHKFVELILARVNGYEIAETTNHPFWGASGQNWGGKIWRKIALEKKNV